MPHTEAGPWWAEVQDLRDAIERRKTTSSRRADHRARRATAAGDHDHRVTGTGEHAARASRAREVYDAPAPVPLSPERRTVQITGRAAAPARPRLVEVDRRRPARRPVDRIAHSPDRIAMWAAVLGFLLILVAAASSGHL